MTPGLLLSLLLSQTPDIHYTAESVEEGVQRTLESYSFTEWEPSEMKEPLYVGVDEANLRQTASAEGAVVATLPLGAAVRVLEKGKERLKVGEYVNHWYSVEYVDAKGTADAADDAVFKGWLFGNTLTPFRFEGDFDGDGEKEIATVVMSGDFKIRVRVLEPNVKPPRRVSSVDLSPAGQGYLSVNGGPATAKLVPAKTAGVTLLQVDSSPEACGDFRTSYVSYTVPGNKKGVLGKAKLGLEVAGLSDSPTFSRFKVSFQAGKKQLTVVRTNEEEDESGKVVKTKETTRYQLKDGVYTDLNPAPSSSVAESAP
ncbi:SH3 domain-containing protein [Myxococcus qinghaiensis]|uniref:SH3 domain-containing protein n=1 Tax=Myxococcus qinghaiensis TaxID=2906758 RepID=UPI0020A75287|nr:SH3 domain-containing protein [Myxococcus qinghaiensis]MCP3167982.1 SH3 domain-containing protein [Myxococcus qinghaiensis]